MPRRISGFTLIELVIALTLIALLATFAISRFAGLSAESQEATLQGLAGAIRSAAGSQHAIALVNADNGGLDNGFIAGGILFDQGYPVALDFDVPFGSFTSGNDGTPEILEAMNVDLADWTFDFIITGSENGQATRELYITSTSVIATGASAAAIIATNCYVSYDSFLNVRLPPVINIVTTGC